MNKYMTIQMDISLIYIRNRCKHRAIFNMLRSQKLRQE